jgi:DNA polymerase-1
VKGRLLLVDGHAFAYRAFYAIRNLRGPDGRPTNAIFGFLKALERLRQQAAAGLERPQRAPLPDDPTDSSDPPGHPGPCRSAGGLLVVWDGGLDAARQAAWPAYKAQRPEMPADLAAQ